MEGGETVDRVGQIVGVTKVGVSAGYKGLVTLLTSVWNWTVPLKMPPSPAEGMSCLCRVLQTLGLYTSAPLAFPLPSSALCCVADSCLPAGVSSKPLSPTVALSSSGLCVKSEASEWGRRWHQAVPRSCGFGSACLPVPVIFFLGLSVPRAETASGTPWRAASWGHPHAFPSGFRGWEGEATGANANRHIIPAPALALV